MSTNIMLNPRNVETGESEFVVDLGPALLKYKHNHFTWHSYMNIK